MHLKLELIEIIRTNVKHYEVKRYVFSTQNETAARTVKRKGADIIKWSHKCSRER